MIKQFKLTVALAVCAAAVVVPATTATAATSPGYGAFTGCPDRADNSDIQGCAVISVSGGHLLMGTKDTPIEDPIKMVMSITSDQQTVIGSFDGGRQRIPGGLIGMTGLDWLRFIYPFGLLQIYAEPQLAGTVTNPLDAIGLPLKVRLDNALLNSNCFIGSNSNPIDLHLTTATTNPQPPNQPITGQPGTLSVDPVLPGVIHSNDIIYVDNEFAAPAATNCDLLGLNLVVTALVNAQAGLPSAAGRNETVQETDLDFGVIQAIYQPNGIEQ
jgi:hypothetical protein